MSPTLLVVFIVIVIGWGIISSMSPRKSGQNFRKSGRDGDSSVSFADFGSSDGGCDGGGGGGGGD